MSFDEGMNIILNSCCAISVAERAIILIICVKISTVYVVVCVIPGGCFIPYECLRDKEISVCTQKSESNDCFNFFINILLGHCAMVVS